MVDEVYRKRTHECCWLGILSAKVICVDCGSCMRRVDGAVLFIYDHCKHATGTIYAHAVLLSALYLAVCAFVYYQHPIPMCCEKPAKEIQRILVAVFALYDGWLILWICSNRNKELRSVGRRVQFHVSSRREKVVKVGTRSSGYNFLLNSVIWCVLLGICLSPDSCVSFAFLSFISFHYILLTRFSQIPLP